ncbi:hypothetical protein B0H11DRAFT_2222420 [Mycena galericulata]|nr:hypothetical protein B0H11DRAFT_2222420 [Mycena galericulata]
MSNGSGDHIQSTLESWPDNTWCGATTGKWCVRASVFGAAGQTDSAAGIAKRTDTADYDYFLYPQHFAVEQTNGGADVAGEVIATTYTNTVITLDAADPTFGNILVLSGGATSSRLVSS